MSVEPEAEFAGYVLDGRTAVVRPAKVAVRHRGLDVVTEDGVARAWPFTAIRQTQGFRAGDPLRFEHRGAVMETLIVHDRAILHRMTANGGSARAGRRTAGAVVVMGLGGIVALAVALAAVMWGIPAASAILAGWVPSALEDRLGQSVIASLPAQTVCRDPERERVIRGLVERLAAARGVAAPTVVVADIPVINAFALPGRRILVFRGLVDLTDSPEMLTGVLAHELAHIVRRHPMQGVLRREALSFVVSTLSAGTFSGGAAATLTALNYSREMEEEADRDAVAMLKAARIDPIGLARFLERMNTAPANAPASTGIFRYLSSHPPARSRASLVRELAAQPAVPPDKLLVGYGWEEMRELCLPR
ncbi:MAG TPA: M48 family metallopeptidase [Candidatus Acidoferrum sp.]|nr:M48 family metallopeptidase [Candidatus Acidoferrum sp.]